MLKPIRCCKPICNFTVSMIKAMRYAFLSLFFLIASILPALAQQSDSSRKLSGFMNQVLQQVKSKQAGPINTTDVVNGLKQALDTGVQRSVTRLGSMDGFLANAAVKILLPPEAQSVEKTLRSLGMGKLVDDAILSMNRAAEQATRQAAPIFFSAIRGMSIQDAWGILHGADTAATGYLRSRTAPALTTAFRPVIDSAVQQTGATRYWNQVFSNYNRFAARKVNPDLGAYVTEKALQGIFLQLAEEEKAIRKNPAARTTDLLRKVFGQ